MQIVFVSQCNGYSCCGFPGTFYCGDNYLNGTLPENIGRMGALGKNWFIVSFVFRWCLHSTCISNWATSLLQLIFGHRWLASKMMVMEELVAHCPPLLVIWEILVSEYLQLSIRTLTFEIKLARNSPLGWRLLHPHSQSFWSYSSVTSQVQYRRKWATWKASVSVPDKWWRGQ